MDFSSLRKRNIDSDADDITIKNTQKLKNAPNVEKLTLIGHNAASPTVGSYPTLRSLICSGNLNIDMYDQLVHLDLEMNFMDHPDVTDTVTQFNDMPNLETCRYVGPHSSEHLIAPKLIKLDWTHDFSKNDECESYGRQIDVSRFIELVELTLAHWLSAEVRIGDDQLRNKLRKLRLHHVEILNDIPLAETQLTELAYYWPKNQDPSVPPKLVSFETKSYVRADLLPDILSKLKIKSDPSKSLPNLTELEIVESRSAYLDLKIFPELKKASIQKKCKIFANANLTDLEMSADSVMMGDNQITTVSICRGNLSHVDDTNLDAVTTVHINKASGRLPADTFVEAKKVYYGNGNQLRHVKGRPNCEFIKTDHVRTLADVNKAW